MQEELLGESDEGAITAQFLDEEAEPPNDPERAPFSEDGPNEPERAPLPEYGADAPARALV
jgi:hypothetical protein